MARTTKDKKARKSAKSESAEKRIHSAAKSDVAKKSGKASRSTPGANAQSQQAAPTSLFKFRRYKKKEGKKKVKHPKLIVEENETEYGFMGFTEEPKSGHRKNIELTQNPKKGDTRPAYIRKELRYDITENFSEVLENYNLSEEDKKAIIEYLNKRKKKK